MKLKIRVSISERHHQIRLFLKCIDPKNRCVFSQEFFYKKSTPIGEAYLLSQEKFEQSLKEHQII